MSAGRGTSEGRFLIEVGGIAAVRASEVSGVDKTHTPFKLSEANRPNPRLGRATFECGVITVKHAHALNSAGEEFFQWIDFFVTGADLSRRSARVIELDEDGQSPVGIWECVDCIPISIKQESNKADGKEASYFTFTFQPENIDLE